MCMSKLVGRMAEAGITQRALARRMGKNKNTVNRKVNGAVPFDADEIREVAAILHITSPAEVAEIFLLCPSLNRDGGEFETSVGASVVG